MRPSTRVSRCGKKAISSRRILMAVKVNVDNTCTKKNTVNIELFIYFFVSVVLVRPLYKISTGRLSEPV